jgi:hypothetical protein
MALSSASLAARRDLGGARTAPTPTASKAGRTPAGSRPARRWLTALMLFVAAALAVAYIANAIAVNNLVGSIASLEREREGVRSENERLRGELLRMMSVERVTALASGPLGLVSPQRPPIALSPNPGAATATPAAPEEGTETGTPNESEARGRDAQPARP